MYTGERLSSEKEIIEFVFVRMYSRLPEQSFDEAWKAAKELGASSSQLEAVEDALTDPIALAELHRRLGPSHRR